MGTAMLSALLEKGLTTPEDIFVSDISEERREYLKQKYGVAVTSDHQQAVDGVDIVVLAVKPQNVPDVLPVLAGQLKPVQLVLSIMAGITIKTLTTGMEHHCVVRVMPNTPAQIGEGMSVWTATTEVTEKQKGWAGDILKAIGMEIFVDDEKYLDMATAVMGSGPAYFFLFVEALVEAAVDIGFSPDMARELVLQTMLGSGRLIQESGKAPAELRRMVTSKGGTTAAALDEMGKGGFNELVLRAVKAAYNRARELGGEGA